MVDIKKLAAFLLGTQKPLRIGVLQQSYHPRLTVVEREQLDNEAIECPGCGFWVRPENTIKHEGEKLCDNCLNNVDDDL